MRADRLRFPTAELAQAVREDAGPLAEAASVKLEVRLERAPPEVFVDGIKAKQAAMNLLRNAIEASPREGTVTLSIERGGSPDGVVFLVDDEGPGVPPELGDRVYLPFVTTKVKGTGLGLAIVRRIAEVHNGSIQLEPRKPKGTRARLELA